MHPDQRGVGEHHACITEAESKFHVQFTTDAAVLVYQHIASYTSARRTPYSSRTVSAFFGRVRFFPTFTFSSMLFTNLYFLNASYMFYPTFTCSLAISSCSMWHLFCNRSNFPIGMAASISMRSQWSIAPKGSNDKIRTKLPYYCYRQVGFTDLSPCGGKIDTPNLDKLSKGGIPEPAP